MQTLKSILTRLNNKGTILALASLIVTLLIQFGFNFDSEKVNNAVQIICNILIILGILNDTTDNTAAYVPGIIDKLIDKDK